MDTEVQSLAAQLLALQVVVSALLRSHPSPESALAEVPALVEPVRAMLLITNWTDAQIEKFETELELLLRGLR